ncbi:MAG: nuclease-related domain-containing protein [Anaerolineales bacterium]|nr:nuclease-related domain-containing protein [Anaerolineales bacterium]
MKIIDKTPLQDKKGNISFTARVRGTLKYGLNWYADLEAQKRVIAQLSRVLEKGFVVIRNFTLPDSEIVIPIILVGTGGIFVIYVTNAKGFFEAKGDQWNTIRDGISQPARINLLSRVAQLTRAFQKYLEIHKFKLSTTPESVLIASNPGAQIESLRPVARVVRSDAIKQFAASLLQAPPIMSAGMVYDLGDYIIDPSLRREAPPAGDPAEEPFSRAQAIFSASDPSKPFDPNDLGFAFEDENAPQGVPPNLRETNPAIPLPDRQPIPAKEKIFGMTNAQVIVLAAMSLIECCILIGFGAFLYLNQ